MAVPQEKLFISVGDYLEGEKVAKVRHEYVDGQVFAMAGESKRHNKIAGRIFRKLGEHLEDSNCDVYFESIKVSASSFKFYYPDVVVVCRDNSEDEYVLTNPRLIVEILSPSTERTDRAEKLLAYKKIESLEEYVIVAQDRVFVQVHRRQDADNWTAENFLELSDEITLTSVNCLLKVADIYQNISFPIVETEEE